MLECGDCRTLISNFWWNNNRWGPETRDSCQPHRRRFHRQLCALSPLLPLTGDIWNCHILIIKRGSTCFLEKWENLKYLSLDPLRLIITTQGRKYSPRVSEIVIKEFWTTIDITIPTLVFWAVHFEILLNIFVIFSIQKQLKVDKASW